LGLPLDDSTFFDICLARGSMALASLPPSLSSSDGSNKESTLTKFPLLNTPLFTFTRKCSYLPPSLTLSTILAYTLHSTCSPLPRPHRRHSPSISDPTIFPLINRFCFNPSFGSLLGEYICNYPITTFLWRLFLPTTHVAMTSSPLPSYTAPLFPLITSTSSPFYPNTQNITTSKFSGLGQLPCFLESIDHLPSSSIHQPTILLGSFVKLHLDLTYTPPIPKSHHST